MSVDSVVKKQLEFLKDLYWGFEGGYVFFPIIDAESAAGDPRTRKNGWVDGVGYYWPDDARIVDAHLREHYNDDIYFTPTMFEKRSRSSDPVTLDRLYADLDDKANVPEDLDPTWCWETSPGRYAAIWLATEQHERDQTKSGLMNQRLTYHVNADRSGWDTGQLLRLPYSVNNKAHVGGKRGKMVSTNEEYYTWEYLGKTIPGLPRHLLGGTEVSVTEHTVREIQMDRDVLKEYASKLGPTTVRRLMQGDDLGMDRSKTAFGLEKDLAKAGMSIPEMIVVMEPTVWNKYRGRQTEFRDLSRECSKAYSIVVHEEKLEELQHEEHPEAQALPDPQGFQHMRDYIEAEEPPYLIDKCLPVGGCMIIAGIPKSLKSWIAEYMAICMATKHAFLEKKVSNSANVLYIQAEDNEILVRKRQHAIARTMNPNWALDVPFDEVEGYPAEFMPYVNKGWNATDPEHLVWLEYAIEKFDIQAVIIDTLTMVTLGTDMNNAADISTVLGNLKVIARRTECAMVVVHHMKKDMKSARAGQNVAGSQQIHAWADAGMYFNEKPAAGADITFDLETKSTSTETLSYRIEGMDVGRFEPQYIPPSVETSRPTRERKVPTGESIANAEPPKAIQRKRAIAKYLKVNPDATKREISRELDIPINSLYRLMK
jgi:AAA domain/RepB DNA-primase N-terminal domain